MADPAMPDFWPFYGNKKLSDVDIILAEEEPAAAAAAAEVPGSSAATAAAGDAETAPDAATAAEKLPAAAEDGATAGAGAAAPRAGTSAAAAAAAGDSKPYNTPTEAEGASAAAADGAIAVSGKPAAAAEATAASGGEQAAAATDPSAVTSGGSSADNPAAAAKTAPAAAPAAAASSKRKRQEGEHIFGHSQVLAAFSDYCRTKLLDWDDATDTAEQQRSGSSISRATWQLRREIQLLVPAGQLEMGRLLVRGMYQQQPDLSGVTQAQLIQLLLLADRFEVPKVQAAVSAAFKALPPEQLQWETVLAVHSLPAGCADLAACQDLFSAVAAKLQQELGDLELALTDPKSSKAQQLLELPCGALKQLLQDERTRVASENAVFFAIQKWHQHQQQQIQASNRPQRQREQQLKSLQQQAQELLQLVRMPQCSQLFIASVVGQSELAASLCSHQELLLASSITRSATAGQRQLPGNAADLPVFQRHPSWLLPPRPPSAMTQLTIDWQLPLAQLKEAFEQHLESGEESYVCGDSRVWQGLTVFPRVEFITEDSGQLLGLYCSAELPEGECCSIASGCRAKSFKRGP